MDIIQTFPLLKINKLSSFNSSISSLHMHPSDLLALLILHSNASKIIKEEIFLISPILNIFQILPNYFLFCKYLSPINFMAGNEMTRQRLNIFRCLFMTLWHAIFTSSGKTTPRFRVNRTRYFSLDQSKWLRSTF